jgi:hypothetical protein
MSGKRKHSGSQEDQEECSPPSPKRARTSTRKARPPPLPASFERLFGKSASSQRVARYQLNLICKDPPIYEIPGFLPEKECDQIEQLAARVKPEASYTENEEGEEEYRYFFICAWLLDWLFLYVCIDWLSLVYFALCSDERTSTSFFPDAEAKVTPLTSRIQQRGGDIVGMPYVNAEPVQVVQYDLPGQRFTKHHDAGNLEIDPETGKLSAEFSKRGKRLVTFFAYVRDCNAVSASASSAATSADKPVGLEPTEDKGKQEEKKQDNSGCTFFPDAKPFPLYVRPKRGSALLWSNVRLDDPSQIDLRTVHEGLPTVKGQHKIGLNLWFVERPMCI